MKKDNKQIRLIVVDDNEALTDMIEEYFSEHQKI